MNNVVNVEELTVNYDKTPALWDVHFTVPPALVGIVGPNGAGKSTLLKALLGMVKPLTGKIEFFGLPLHQVRKKVAYVPQRSSVDWDFPLTAFDLVLMGRFGKLGPFRWPSRADRKAVESALDKVGMLPFAKRQIGELSGGQQQRLFVARALLQEADLYLMDEPFAGIDIATEKALMALFEELRKAGKTLFIVHHDLHTVERYFDWLLLLNTCLVASGPLKQVFSQENILRTYGRSSALLDEVAKLSKEKRGGL
jgi:manganese/zinc/iron transport system ATP- binding protein